MKNHHGGICLRAENESGQKVRSTSRLLMKKFNYFQWRS